MYWLIFFLIYEAMIRSEFFHHSAGPMKNMDEALNQINIWLKDWSICGYGYWMISSRESSDILGIGGVRRMKWNDRDILNLYYRFSPKAWGKGYATELARYVIGLARQHLSNLPIVARIRPYNIPSLKVAERSGLLRQPSLDNDEHIIYSAG